MNTITLTKPNQSIQSGLRTNLTAKLIAVFILAFCAGVVTMVKPIFLLAIPLAGLLFGIVKLILVCKDVLDIKFDIEGVELSYEEVLDELRM